MSVNETKLQATLLKILTMDIDQWETAAEMLADIGDRDYQHAESALSALSVRAGELSYYLGYRGAFGTGDHGHERAFTLAEKKRKVLRKANGYSYP
jgi:hypothetical protein